MSNFIDECENPQSTLDWYQNRFIRKFDDIMDTYLPETFRKAVLLTINTIKRDGRYIADECLCNEHAVNFIEGNRVFIE